MRLAARLGSGGQSFIPRSAALQTSTKPPTKPSAEEQARDAQRGPVETAKLPREVSQTFLGMRSIALRDGVVGSVGAGRCVSAGPHADRPLSEQNRTSNNMGDGNHRGKLVISPWDGAHVLRRPISSASNSNGFSSASSGGDEGGRNAKMRRKTKHRAPSVGITGDSGRIWQGVTGGYPLSEDADSPPASWNSVSRPLSGLIGGAKRGLVPPWLYCGGCAEKWRREFAAIANSFNLRHSSLYSVCMSMAWRQHHRFPRWSWPAHRVSSSPFQCAASAISSRGTSRAPAPARSTDTARSGA